MSFKPVSGAKVLSPKDHVVRMAVAVLTFPWTLVRLAYRGVRRVAEARKSPEARREEDQRRQSRARRTLRGLTPDHAPDGRRSRP